MRSYAAFTSMPFGDSPDSDANMWSRLYEHGIKPCEKLAFDDALFARPSSPGCEDRRLVIHRADHNLQALGLKENVRFLIDHCDFVICVLTVEGNDTRLMNPNLLWEIGYAEARRRPIVFLGNNEAIRRIPALVGADNLFCRFDPRVFQPDTPCGPIAQLGQKVAQDLMPFIRSAIGRLEERQPGRHGTYEVTAHADRRRANLREFIASATSSIDILTTNLDDFLHQVAFEFENRDSILRAPLERGVTVRLVVMDPDCHIAEYRARQLGMSGDVGQYREELRNAIVKVYSLFEGSYGDHFRMKVYEDLPLQITLRVDNEVITSFVTRGKRSRDRVHVRFRVEDEGVYDTFVGHFGSVYDSAKDIREFSWLYRELQSRRQSPSNGVVPAREPLASSVQTPLGRANGSVPSLSERNGAGEASP